MVPSSDPISYSACSRLPSSVQESLDSLRPVLPPVAQHKDQNASIWIVEISTALGFNLEQLIEELLADPLKELAPVDAHHFPHEGLMRALVPVVLLLQRRHFVWAVHYMLEAQPKCMKTAPCDFFQSLHTDH